MTRLAVLACIAAALLVDFGAFHRFHDADSLVPMLMSLTHWTPFFWEQDRYGMPFALVAMPVRDPIANLLVQNVLSIASGLGATVMLVRFAWPHPAGTTVGLVAAALLLLAAPPTFSFAYLSTYTAYGPALAFGVGGLLLATATSPLRLGVGLALLVLAHWVNSTAWLVLLPLALLVDRPERRTRAILVGAGVAAGLVLVHLAPDREAGLDQLPLAAWPAAWRDLLAVGTATLLSGAWAITLGACAALGVGAAMLPTVRQNAAAPLRAAAVLLVIGLAYLLLLGTSTWVRANGNAMRYLVPSLLLLHGAVVVAAVGPVLAFVGPRAHPALAAGALVIAALLAYGPPGMSVVRADLDRTIGARTADVNAARCTHLVGSYFPVWETVFHAMVLRWDRGDRAPIYGLTHRSGPTRDLWSAIPLDHWRVCVPVGDEAQAGFWMYYYAIVPLTTIEQQGAVNVLGIVTERPLTSRDPNGPDSAPLLHDTGAADGILPTGASAERSRRQRGAVATPPAKRGA